METFFVNNSAESFETESQNFFRYEPWALRYERPRKKIGRHDEICEKKTENKKIKRRHKGILVSLEALKNFFLFQSFNGNYNCF